MRKNPQLKAELCRKAHPLHGNSPPGADFGYFEIPFESYVLSVIASSGVDVGWDHVSVSLRNRCPNWKEMCFIKDLFWEPEECVIQFHPPESKHVNIHPHCLHLWKSAKRDFPLPPEALI